MKTTLFTLLLIISILRVDAQISDFSIQKVPEDYGYIVKIGQTLPDIQFELTDGTIITKQDLNGKVVMLQFTASWCSVCRKEMPHIENEIWQKYKNNKNFLLFGIDMDEPLETVKNFAETMEITYPLALDPEGKIFYTFAAEGAGVTRNVIIDKNGNIAFMTRLFKEDEFNEMKNVIDLLLKSI